MFYVLYGIDSNKIKYIIDSFHGNYIVSYSSSRIYLLYNQYYHKDFVQEIKCNDEGGVNTSCRGKEENQAKRVSTRESKLLRSQILRQYDSENIYRAIIPYILSCRIVLRPHINSEVMREYYIKRLQDYILNKNGNPLNFIVSFYFIQPMKTRHFVQQSIFSTRSSIICHTRKIDRKIHRDLRK